VTTPYDYNAAIHTNFRDVIISFRMNSGKKVYVHLGHEEMQEEESSRAQSPPGPLQLATATCPNLREWKLIHKSEDKRLLWRRLYDEGKVPWFPIYDNLNFDLTQTKSTFAIYFHVKKYWDEVEIACQDDVCHSDDENIHQQRLHYFETIGFSFIIKETYQATCSWYPISSYIDSVKWSKLAKKMNFFSSMKNVAHEVDMAFHRHSKERKMDLSGFESVLRELAYMRYPPPLYEHDVRWQVILTLFITTTYLNQLHTIFSYVQIITGSVAAFPMVYRCEYILCERSHMEAS